jgi:tetratricopeptide (TPR) repeat protein
MGVILYEMLTGRLPFEGSTAGELYQSILGSDPKSPRSVAPDVPREIEVVCSKAIEKERARRYPTARRFAADLRRFLAGEAVQARPASMGYRLLRFATRRKAVVAVAAAALTLTGAMAAVLVPRWLREKSEKERVAREKERELEAERARARERETALRELAVLWTQVVLAKQGLYRETADPARVRRDIEESLGRVSGYIGRHPNHPQGFYVRARGRLYLEDLEGAEADLRRALEMEPAFAPGEALLGRVLLERLGRDLYGFDGPVPERRSAGAILPEARRHLERGWPAEGESRSVEAWGLPKTREDEVAEVLARAMFHVLVENRRADAEALLRKAHEAEPSEEFANLLGNLEGDPRRRIDWQSQAIRLMRFYAKAHLDRGSSRCEIEDFAGARADLDEAIRIHPRFAAAFCNRAVVRLAVGDFPGALADCDEALKIRPSFAEALHNRASVRHNLQEYDAAIADCDEAIRLRPDFAIAFDTRGAARKGKGDLAAAIADFDQAIRIGPESARVYYNRANARSAQGDKAGAIADYDAAIRLQPNFGRAFFNRALVRLDQGDRKGAIEDCGETLRIDPGHSKAYMLRGDTRQETGDLDGAISDYTAAIRIDATLSEAWANRGSARHMKGDRKNAIADYTEAIRLHPRFAHAWANRGAALSEEGDRKGAIADLEEALEVAPPDWPLRPAVTEALERLRQNP